MHFIHISWPGLIWPFVISLGISLLLTPVALWLARRRKLFDMPSPRRVHTSPTPRLGGIAIFWAILLATWYFFPGNPHLIGLELGLIIIFTLGLADDLYSLPPNVKLLGQIAAASAAICFGITIGSLTNPFTGLSVALTPGLDVVLTLIWILLVINTINLLDGLDGLAAGVSGIASISLVVLSLTAIVNQPDTARLAAIVAGAALGFLAFNWHPAKIFMGDAGSHVLGFMLAVLAIISGGKLATASLVLAVPIIDVGWAFVRRLARGQSPFAADREHLHHLLVDLGLTQRQTVGLLYLAAIVVGTIALLSHTRQKLFIMLGVLIGVAIIIALIAYFRRTHHIRH